jgi:hypothetical protein
MLAAIPRPEAPVMGRRQSVDDLTYPSDTVFDGQRRGCAAHIGSHPAGMYDNGDESCLSPCRCQLPERIVKGCFKCTGVRRGTRRGMHPLTGSGILTNQLESNAPAGPNNHCGWHV